MKIRSLLVNPPFYRLLGSKYNAHSLGLAYVSAARKYINKGAEVAIYNADFSDKDYGNLTEIFNSQNEYLEYFKNEDHPLWDEIVEKILEYEPEMVGYTCYTANVPSVNIISKKIKETGKVPFQEVGGPHVRLSVDRGAEKDFPHVNRFWYLDERAIANVHQADFLPDRECFWGVTEEQKKKIDLSYIITSRGCPYKCTFCANPSMWGNRVEFSSPDAVLKEMRIMKEEHGQNELYILDDTFTLKSSRVKEILSRMIDERLNLKWRCNTRLDRLDEEICALMKEAGCIEAKVGVESGSDEILRLIKKGETKRKMRRGVELLKESDIPITAYFMAGFPQETDEDVKDTIEFAKELDVDRYSLSIFAPYYGSELYFDLMKSGEISQEGYEYFYHQSPRPLANRDISDKVLEEYFALSKLNKDGRYGNS